MQEEMKKDKWGYLVHTSSDECIKFLNEFYQQVLNYGSRKKIILQAVQEDENCVLANSLAAWYMQLDPATTKQYLHQSKLYAEKATDYERLVSKALETTSEDSFDKALSVHSEILEKFPRDLVSLKRAQVLAFSRGRSDMMLKFASQALHENIESPYMYGMMAFALVEQGRTEEADTAARKALSIEKNDVWAQHAMCHVLQEKQQFKEAIKFMECNAESWEDCGSFLYSHHWWHLAICHLESEEKSSLENALRIFDMRIWGDRERDEKDLFPVSLNALGLLLCVEVKGYGECINERVLEVAKQFTDEAKWHQEWLLDLLVIWSLARCSYYVEAKRLISNLRERVHVLGSSDQIHETILSLACALYEYGSGNEKVVSSLLGSSFNARELKVIGASNEQMRVFGQIWSETTGKTSKLN